MAEGLLRGMLGGEEDEKAASTKAGSEAFAAAVAARLSASDPEVAKDTSTFLKEQTELLKAQRKSVEAEHEYFELEWGPRLLGVRLRIAFQIFIALAATVIGVGVAIMIHDAVTSRRVVVDPFDIAPNVAAQVPSGKIIAAGLLDELSRLQDATRSQIERRDLSNAWASQVKLEVPETGISLGEISRLLRERFGDDVHIDGDLIATRGGPCTHGSWQRRSRLRLSADLPRSLRSSPFKRPSTSTQNPSRHAGPITCRTPGVTRRRLRSVARRSAAPARTIDRTC